MRMEQRSEPLQGKNAEHPIIIDEIQLSGPKFITLAEAQKYWNGSGRRLAQATGQMDKKERAEEVWDMQVGPTLLTKRHRVTFDRKGSGLKATVVKR